MRCRLRPPRRGEARGAPQARPRAALASVTHEPSPPDVPLACRAVADRAQSAAIPYTVRRSPRARRVRVNVHAHAGVEVVLPQRASERAAAAAISELRPWIERRLGEAQRALAQIAARGGTIPYLGRPLQLVPQAGRTQVGPPGARPLG